MGEMSDAQIEKELVRAKELVKSIRRAKILWMDEQGREISWEVIDCIPGETITAKVPVPDDVQIQI